MAEGRQALLIMDIQPLVTPAFGGDDALLDRLSGAAKSARSAGVPVLFGKVSFRPGYADVAGSNQLFSALPGMGLDFQESNSATDYHPTVAPQDGDHAFTKRRVSSFAGSDLEVLLRSLQVDHIVLTGVATSASSSPPCGRPRTWTTGSRCSPTAAPTRTPRSTTC